MSVVFDRISSAFNKLNSRPSFIRKALIALGVLWSSQIAFDFLRFVRVYYLRRSTVHRYIKPSNGARDTWALVTGSSDGIGKGFAEELCSRGVNVVIHGRNEGKLNRVKEDLLNRWPERQIRILLLDAGSDLDDDKLNEVRDSLKDLNIRILVNNIGGNGSAHPLFKSFVDRSFSDISQFMNINARFTTEITRILLPQMIESQPSLILNIGSGLSDFPSPYLGVYGGTKAYLHQFSRSLRLEMIGEGHDVEVLHLQVGGVQSNTTPRPTGLLVPSSRQFAWYCLEAAGCGKEMVWPYWPHARQFGFILAVPDWLRNKLLLTMVKKVKEEFETGNYKS